MIRTLVRFASRPAPSSGPPTGPPARGRGATGASAGGASNEIGEPNEIGAPNAIGSDAAGAPFGAVAAPPPKSIESPPNGSAGGDFCGSGDGRSVGVEVVGSSDIAAHASTDAIPPGGIGKPAGA